MFSRQQAAGRTVLFVLKTAGGLLYQKAGERLIMFDLKFDGGPVLSG